MNAQQEMTDANKAQMSARYQRAETLAAGFVTSNLVQNDVLAPHWITDSDYFWYERATKTSGENGAKTGKEYRLVNVKAASNESAFDHAGLAKALAVASGKEGGEVESKEIESFQTLKV